MINTEISSQHVTECKFLCGYFSRLSYLIAPKRSRVLAPCYSSNSDGSYEDHSDQLNFSKRLAGTVLFGAAGYALYKSQFGNIFFLKFIYDLTTISNF